MGFIPLVLFAIIFTTDTNSIPTPHTSSNVTVSDCASCQFAHLYELNFYFVNMSTNIPVNNFTLGPNETFEYGLVLTNRSIFNMLYSLTCVKKDNETALSPKVTFVTGADGPDKPNINVISYYGAKGTFDIVYGVCN